MLAGDPAPYAALWADGAQPTLFGAWGTVEKGHEAVTSTFTWVGSRFSDGTSRPLRYVTVDWSEDWLTPWVSRRPKSASTAGRPRP